MYTLPIPILKQLYISTRNWLDTHAFPNFQNSRGKTVHIKPRLVPRPALFYVLRFWSIWMNEWMYASDNAWEHSILSVVNNQVSSNSIEIMKILLWAVQSIIPLVSEARLSQGAWPTLLIPLYRYSCQEHTFQASTGPDYFAILLTCSYLDMLLIVWYICDNVGCRGASCRETCHRIITTVQIQCLDCILHH